MVLDKVSCFHMDIVDPQATDIDQFIVDNIGNLLPLFEQFGGYRSSYIGSSCVKIDLKDKNIIFKD